MASRTMYGQPPKHTATPPNSDCSDRMPFSIVLTSSGYCCCTRPSSTEKAAMGTWYQELAGREGVGREGQRREGRGVGGRGEEEGGEKGGWRWGEEEVG